MLIKVHVLGLRGRDFALSISMGPMSAGLSGLGRLLRRGPGSARAADDSKVVGTVVRTTATVQRCRPGSFGPPPAEQGLCVVGLVSRLASQHRCGRRSWPRAAGPAADGWSGCGRPVRLRPAGPVAMDPGTHLAGAARQHDGYPNSHPFSAMDPGIHRAVRPRRARWIRESIAGAPLHRANPARRRERAVAAAAREPDQAAPSIRHPTPPADQHIPNRLCKDPDPPSRAQRPLPGALAPPTGPGHPGRPKHSGQSVRCHLAKTLPHPPRRSPAHRDEFGNSSHPNVPPGPAWCDGSGNRSHPVIILK